MNVIGGIPSTLIEFLQFAYIKNTLHLTRILKICMHFFIIFLGGEGVGWCSGETDSLGTVDLDGTIVPAPGNT
jgi:hypothetical protein